MQAAADEHDVALKRALATLAEERGADLADKIRPIVEKSNRACRLSRVLKHGDANTVDEYVERVVAVYEQEWERMEKLLVDKESAAWQALHDQAFRTAYSFLQRNLPGRPHHALQDDANRIAAETMISVLDGNYHFDVDFDRWVTVVVINQALKEIDRKIVPRNDEIEVDAYENWLENLEQLRRTNDPQLIELRYDLLKALDCLPSTLHRQVIRLRYFEGLSPAETANRLGKSKNSIYKAHHYAIKNLRVLLSNDEGDEP